MGSALTEPEVTDDGQVVDRRPLIDTSNAELHALADAAWSAIVRANDPPQMFHRGSELVYIDEHELLMHNQHTLSDLMSRAARWRRFNKQGEPSVVYPSDRVAKIVLNWPTSKYNGVPVIDRVARTPFFVAPEGTSVWDADEDGLPEHQVRLVTEPGYHADARIWLEPDPALADLPEVTGSDDELAEAVKIVNGMLGDFPFAGRASTPHAISLLLLPFVRELIDGDTPLYLITAPTAGTGKGLLTDVLLIPAEREIPRTTLAGDEAEVEKRITSELLAAPSIVLFDNIAESKGLDSAAMAAVLTSGGKWRGRILGKSQMATLPVRNIWVATGNNVQVSNEHARRVARIHLDRGSEDPAAIDPGNFAIPNLHAYVRTNRRDVVWAALTIVQSWLHGHTVEGDTYRPWLLSGSKMKQSYIEWSRVMGGLLQHLRVEGFGEQDDLLDTTARDDLASFFEAWEREAPQPLTSREVASKCQSFESEMNLALPSELVGLRPGELEKQLGGGLWLREHRDRVAGGRKLMRSKARPYRWSIEHVA